VTTPSPICCGVDLSADFSLWLLQTASRKVLGTGLMVPVKVTLVLLN